MNNSLRRSLFYSTDSALLAAGSHAAMAQTGATVLGGGSTLAARDYETEFLTDSLYSGAGEDFTYCSVGSGAGTSAFVSNTVTPLLADTTNCTGVTPPVDYGASDAVISATNVSFFKSSYNRPLIQLPMFGTPITFPFHLGAKTDGAETLTDADLCGIFWGAITDWHTIDPTIPAGRRSRLPTVGMAAAPPS